ncbi:DUF4007 family protein [Tenacibaculum singaporense]|uniref:DUF4007 family protein n=1 Tax=Tenacibaculum singaporense TaxID=2358479 RepID=UPI0013DDE8D1|nr:DUF4007 family protein [Tenacibaculum singaporense]
MGVDILEEKKYIFSGHETFHCKGFWLKKGYDYVKQGRKFIDESCISLGVGRNMVSSIRFWLKAFNIIDQQNEEITPLGNFIFNENNGVDKYLENETTLWLLHFSLIQTNFSSIYSIIFNEIRKTKPEFNKSNLIAFLNEHNVSFNENTVNKDFSVLTRTYFSKSNDKEDSFSGILSSLELLEEIKHKDSNKYIIHNKKTNSIPVELLLFCILENDKYGLSISHKSLSGDANSIGNIFAMNNDQLDEKLTELSSLYKEINYTSNSGVKELQFKNKNLNSYSILRDYYENQA